MQTRGNKRESRAERRGQWRALAEEEQGHGLDAQIRIIKKASKLWWEDLVSWESPVTLLSSAVWGGWKPGYRTEGGRQAAREPAGCEELPGGFPRD